MPQTSTKAEASCEHLKKLIREVPDFPKPGILFYDITTLLKDKVGFANLIDALSEHYLDKNIDLVLGMEARGFIFGPAVAYRLNAGFVPVRKPGKLPAATTKFDYALEYGTNTLEIHRDAIQERPAGGDCRRPPRHRGHGRSYREACGIVGRRYRGNGIRGGVGFPQSSRQAEEVRCVLLAALR